MELTGNFVIDINKFSNLSIEVGYANCKANQKDENGEYDKKEIKKYEKLREAQLDMQELLIEMYHLRF